MISFLRYWLPLLVWMAVIFSASADTQSTEHTSRFLEPFLRWLNPNISAEAIDAVRWCVRKTAHMLEFALLAWLVWRALRRPKRLDPRPWSWKIAGATLGIVLLYAATDEFHQGFVPNRTGSIKDVGIDTAGGALGLSLVYFFYQRRRLVKKDVDPNR
jgi:VanZ family protein